LVAAGDEGATLGVAAGGGIVRFGTLGGTGGRAASVACGATVGVGKTVRGGGVARRTGVKVGTGFVAGSIAVDAVAVGSGVLNVGGGTFRRTSGVIAGSGEGRFRTTGETAGVVAAGAGAEASGGVGAGAETDGATDGDGLGRIDGDGRTLTVAYTAGVGDAAVAEVAAGMGLAGFTAGVGLGVNLGRVVGLAAGVPVALVAAVALGEAAAAGVGLAARVAGVGLAAGGADAAGVVAAVAAGVAGAVVLSTGFTNVFGGALGGGVDSVRIFVRARSAAERSAMVQPLSMFTSITRSFMRRGRGISRTSVMTGTEISSSSPRTMAAASVFCRRNR
jgi:hypothetical protein